MNLSTLWPIFLLLASLLAMLAWVGWRFFYSPACLAPRTGDGAHWKWRSLKGPFAPGKHLGRRNGRQAIWILIPVLLAGTTVVTTLSFANHFDLDPLRARELAPEGQVSLRLNQEKLMPPPPLPPAMFQTTDRPNLETADRDWSHLDPEFSQVVLRLFARMSQRGYPVALLEGYRSPERQAGAAVTNARAYQSKHQYGLAADLAPVRDGHLVIFMGDPWADSAYKALGEEAAALGLVWGGLWRLRDFGHVEWASRPGHGPGDKPPSA